MRNTLLLAATVIGSYCAMSSYAGEPPASAGEEVLERAVIHRTVEAVAKSRAAGGKASTTTSNLNYHGGTADGGTTTTGVETTPTIYLVIWGSQWVNNDPSGEQAILTSFLSGVGGSSWLNSVTQYCQGVATGTVSCNGAGTAAGNQTGMLVEVYVDTGSAAPSHPSQSQLAAEAVKVAGKVGRTTAASNITTQYVIATSHGNSSRGFKTQYCAYHSSTTSSYGDIAYTNLPYITDAGANCGANFNGLGPNAGITIVEGHEAGETITDQFPSTGWLDSSGAENGDKCAWIATGSTGAAADVTFSTGVFPVQSLWSNASNGGSCVLTYP